MSRIGKKPINIPSGVKVNIKNSMIEVVGPKGTLVNHLPSSINISIEDSIIQVNREGNEKDVRAMHGTVRSLLFNIVHGVSEGFSKTLEILGTGYRVEQSGKRGLKLNLGYSMPIDFQLPEGITADIEERGTRLIVSGIDKQLVGEVSARIKKLRPPDSYKGKGIRYLGEQLKLKPGKAGIKA